MMTHDDLACFEAEPARCERILTTKGRSGAALASIGDTIAALRGDFPVVSDPTRGRDAFGPLADILGAIGRPWFYRVLADRLSCLLGCQRYLAMRYSQFARPAFLVNNFIPGEFEDLYLQTL